MRNLFASWLVATAAIVTFPAMAHHGWSGYEEKAQKNEGTVKSSKYENPHGTLELEAAGKTLHVVLAPTSRMQSRGLTEPMLKAGTKVTVEAYRKKGEPSELRAERITVAGKTVELR